MTRTFKVLIAAVVVLFLVFAFFGNTQASVEPQIVRVTLTDYKVELSRFAVTPGRPVQFVVDNQGTMSHHFVVQPYVETKMANPEEETVIGAGTTRTVQRTLTPGVYRVECDAWDHAARGMVNTLAAEVTVQSTLPIRMDFVIPILALIFGSVYIIGDSMGLRLTKV